MNSEKVRLLYDATSVCNILLKNSSRSGIFFVSYNILLELLKSPDIEVYLYTDNYKKLKKTINTYPEFKDCVIYKTSFLNNILDNLVDTMYANKGILSLTAKFMYCFINFINKKMLKFWKFNDIDAYLSPMKAVPDFILNKKNIKKYVVLHDTIPLINDYRGVKHGWYEKLIKSINKEDYYFANSQCTKQDFIKYVPNINPEHIEVIPLSTGKPYFKINDTNEINRVKEKYNIPLDKKYIFSLCNLDPRKNLIFSMKNFLKFIEKNKIEDFVFVMGGKPFPDFEKIFNQNLENLEVSKNKILQIGYVDDEDMSALYSGAEMFLFPSLYEGFGMPVLEAMKCGLPVICSNISSIPEVIGDCGITINPTSDEEMVSAIEKMYFDREFRASCIEKALKRSELFTWEKCGDIICNEIKKR